MRITTLALWSVVAVPLPGAAEPAFITPAMPGTRISHHVVTGPITKIPFSFHLYTPAEAATDPVRRFPVLYYLHGSGGGLKGIGPLSAWFDGAMASGKMPPMFVVFPNGLASSLWCDSKDGRMPIETMVMKELIPHMDGHWPTRTNRESRLLEGFSMGGFGAARLGFKYPHVFGAVSILAGGPLDLEFVGPRALENPAERERILKETFGGDVMDFRSKHPLTLAQALDSSWREKQTRRVLVGSRDATRDLNLALSATMKHLGIVHEVVEVAGVGHDTLGLFQGLGPANWGFYRGSTPSP